MHGSASTARSRRRPRRHPWSPDRGASLVETLVALGLFAIAAAAMSSFLTHQVRRSSDNHLHTIGLGLAEAALESARAQRWPEMVSTESSHVEGGVTFTVATVVQNDTPRNLLKTITARVTWNDQLGAHTIEVPVVYTQVNRL